MPKQILVPMVEGSEELEVVSIVDTLRRAGATVTLASCQGNGDLTVKASHGMQLKADTHIRECLNRSFHIIALLGGMPGSEHLRDCPELTQLLMTQKQSGKWLAAICAAPAVVLSHHGLLDNVRATCYPTLMDQLEGALTQAATTVVVDEDKRVITAQGPGVVLAFTFKIIDVLYGKDAHRPIAKQMVASWAL